MTLYETRWVIDAGLFVLIWLTQLIIYPGFRVMDPARFTRWHPRYTARMTGMVLPLMAAQLGIVVYQCVHSLDWYTVTSMILVVLAWASTLLTFVPLHQRLGQEGPDMQVVNRLVARNWSRTVLWTMVVLLDLIFLFH